MAELRPEQNPLEPRAAELFRSVGPAETLSPQTLAQIAERVRQKRERRQRFLLRNARFAFAAAALLLTVDGAWAAVAFYRAPQPLSPVPAAIWLAVHPRAHKSHRALAAAPIETSQPAPVLAPPAARPMAPAVEAPPIVEVKPAEAARAVEAKPPTPAAPEASLVPAPQGGQPEAAPRADLLKVDPPSTPLSRIVTQTPSAPTAVALPLAVAKPVSPRTPPRPSALAEELQVLQHARRPGADPATELRLLADYFKRYPEGLFRAEAQVAQLQAYLQIGEKAQALAVLDQLHATNFKGLPRAQELGVLRAELLAGADRCGEALPALDSVIVHSEALQERALYARAFCLSRIDPVASREVLQDYLRRFPEGQFASRARQALGE